MLRCCINALLQALTSMPSVFLNLQFKQVRRLKGRQKECTHTCGFYFQVTTATATNFFFCVRVTVCMCSPQWGWQNTARDCLESLWDLHPWVPSKPDWTRSSSTPLTLRLALSWTSLVTRDGPDDLQSSLLTYIMIHWYYNLGQFQAWCHRFTFIKEQITGAFIQVSIQSSAQSLTENTVDRLFSKALAHIDQSWHNTLAMSKGFE